MTESEWLTCENPALMLEFLKHDGINVSGFHGISARKIRLWVARMCDISDYPFYDGIENWSWRIGEKCDNEADPNTQEEQWSNTKYDNQGDPPMSVRADLLREILGNPFDMRGLCVRHQHMRPITPVSSCEQCRVILTSDVLAIARVMFDSGDFTDMPILADALEDAGCENEAIIEHCHGIKLCPGCSTTDAPNKSGWCDVCDTKTKELVWIKDETVKHCRGCWVVDLLLGLE